MTAVEMTEVVLDPTIVLPAITQGTVTVVSYVIVVTGIV